ncbi:MAG: EF-hand domain-containing protein [Alphaproteobacteria bacterium]|nr:EF-hand domain-containing protein [Alphaproteobacteria bacterium]
MKQTLFYSLVASAFILVGCSSSTTPEQVPVPERSEMGQRVGKRGMKHGMKMENRFKEKDTNKDGKVSLEEFKTFHGKYAGKMLSEEKFKMVDTNSDGFITKEEYQKNQELRGEKFKKRAFGKRGPFKTK